MLLPSTDPLLQKPRFRVLRCVALLLVLCCAARPVLAASITQWQGNASENWNEAANWSGGSVPSAASNTVVDDTSLNIPKIIGPAASFDGSIGYGAGSAGIVRAQGFGVWNLGGSLSVGDQGTGTLWLENGGKTATGGQGAIGLGSGSTGTARVDGADSQWSVGSNLYIGHAGTGSLHITDNGGVVTGAYGFIGNLAGGEGRVTVSGGGRLLTAGELPVGMAGKGSLTLSTSGSVTNNGIVLAQQAGSNGVLNIGAAPEDPAQATGLLNSDAVRFGLGSGTINFNHNNAGSYRFNPLIGDGNGLVQLYSGTSVFYKSNTYTGFTRVYGGTLAAENESGSATGGSQVLVEAGGTLRGNGFLSGPVTVGGTLAPGGNSPGVLTVGNLELKAGSVVRFRLNNPQAALYGDLIPNDRVDVNGNLTLGGTLEAWISAAGVYRLFNYSGALSGSFDNTSFISGLPDFDISTANMTVDTGTAHQVNLSVQAAGQSLQFWDGSNSTGSGLSLGSGGSGLWTGIGTNWVDMGGNNSAPWTGSVGVFAGSPGTVTLSGSQAFNTLQFFTDGYTLRSTAPGDGELLINRVEGSTLNVGSATSAAVNVPVVDGAGSKLTVTGGGEVTLGGTNSFSGGLRIAHASVRAAADEALGASAGSVDLDSGILRFANAFTVGALRSLTLSGAGGGFDTNGLDARVLAAVSGEGALLKQGSGTLTLDGGAKIYRGKTYVTQGTLALAGTARIADSASVRVDNGAVLDISASSGPQDLQSLSGSGAVRLGAQTLRLTDAYDLFSGTVSGSGIFELASGIAVLGGENTYTGETRIGADSTLILFGKGSVSRSAQVWLADRGRFSAALANSDVAVQSLAGSGRVELGSRNLTLTQASGTFDGVIAGSGGLVLDGGTQRLGGKNTYTGPTLVRGGTLALAGAGSIAASSGLTLYSGSVFDVLGASGGVHEALRQVSVIHGTAAVRGMLNAKRSILNFYLPAGVLPGARMLSADGADIQGSFVNVELPAGENSLQAGDTIVLIDSTDGVQGAPANSTSSGRYKGGVSLRYVFDLVSTADQLLAVLAAPVELVPQTRVFPKGRIASMALASQGADMAAGQGMSAAMAAAQDGLSAFGAGSGGASRYNTGSHVDLDAFALLTGLAVKAGTSSGKLLMGVFFEAGWGSYDSYNSIQGAASVRGEGVSRYQGGGLLARYAVGEGMLHGLYAESAVRTGRMDMDFSTASLRDANGRKASYESAFPYYGAHAGLGWLRQLDARTQLDLSAKYLWTRLGSDAVSIAGDPLRFNTADSHRWRGGARLSRALVDQVQAGDSGWLVDVYAGAYHEYEFNGTTRASVHGYGLPAASLEGGTGMGEAGLVVKQASDGVFSADLGVQGYTGTRQGVAGSLRLRYEF